MVKKCDVCRYTCKKSIEKCQKFYPHVNLLGNPKHFEDPYPHRKHEESSRICVICKQFFHYENIRWKKERDGLYSFCLEDFGTALFIDNMLKETQKHVYHAGDSTASEVRAGKTEV